MPKQPSHGAPGAPALYWLDFIAYPALALGIAAAECRSLGFVALALAGIVLFTLAEYWVHRSLLHRLFYHGTHERHHREPEEYVVFPVWYVPALFAAFYLVMPGAVFAGFCLGYFWFVAWHHVLHHRDLAAHPAIARYAGWHELHHHFMRCNFGITHPLWDVVFGTYRAARPHQREGTS